MHRHIAILLTTCLATLALAVVATPAEAQDRCEEPTDTAYVELMTASRSAIAADDYATALEIFEEANRNYEFVLVDYAIARAFHMLGQYDEAELAYDRFLDQRQGCPDPHGLEELATTYRQEARSASEQAAAQVARVDRRVDGNDPIGASSEDPLEALADSTEASANADVDAEAADNADEAVELTATEDADSGGIDLGWYFVGGGSALILAGVIFDITQADLVDQRLAAYEEGDLEEFLRLDDAINSGRWVEGVLYGVGIAAVTTGVVLLIVQDDEKNDALSLGVGPSRGGGAFVTYGGPF